MFNLSGRRLYTAALLIYFIDSYFSAIATTTIPSSATTVNLQTLSPTDTSFVLPGTTTVNTTQGDGIDADSSRNWQLLIEGVVNAASIGVNFAANNSSLTNSGTITGANGTAIALGGSGNSVILNSGSVINGDIASNGTGNRLTLAGTGSSSGNIAGTVGFDSINVSGAWNLAGGVRLSDSPGATLNIASGATLITPAVQRL